MLCIGIFLSQGVAVPVIAACERLDEPSTRVEVTIEPPAEPVIRAVPQATIRTRARKAAGVGKHPNAVARGLTAGEIRASAGYRLRQATLADGRRCHALGSLSARLWIGKTEILVDQRYPAGSCERDAILRHEREHARINAETLRAWEERIAERLEAAIEPWRDRWLRESVQRRIETAVNDAIRDLVRDIQADADRQHARIDTPASYAAVQRECRGW